MRILRAVFVCTTAYVMTVLPGCLPIPPQGPSYVAQVPYAEQQKPYYCAVACTWMMKQRLNPSNTATQDDIWAWVSTYHGGSAHAGYGMGIDAFVQALRNYTPQYFTIQQYSYGERQRAVADQIKRIEANLPTPVGVNNNGHVVLIMGSSWNRLPDAIQRPSTEAVYVHDPLYPPGTSKIFLGTWMNDTILDYGVGKSVVQFERPEDRNRGYWEGLQQFDQQGGVYVGMAPPDPTGRYRYAGNGNCYWEWNDFGEDQCTPGGVGGSDVLSSGDILWPGNYVDSTDGRFRFIYQTDGNLVLYGPSGAIWATMTFDSPGSVEMQTDGNLVMYNSSGSAVWHTYTYGASGAYFRMQNDGNGVIYAGSTPIWATDTGGW
jgi:hypothetical protein